MHSKEIQTVPLFDLKYACTHTCILRELNSFIVVTAQSSEVVLTSLKKENSAVEVTCF